MRPDAGATRGGEDVRTGEVVARHVYFEFAAGKPPVIADLSFTVGGGEFFVLLGPSGCGKSTVLNLIAGFEHATHGDVLAGGRPITGAARDRMVIFQDSDSLYGWVSVLDNVAFPLRVAGVGRKERHERARAALKLVGLQGHEEKYPAELSGGMKQRTQLARALVLDSPILLMDEPFAALDAQTREILQEELLALMERPDERKTMVFITHSIDEAILLGDRIAVMSARPGRIKEVLDMPFGRPRDVEDVRADPHFAELRSHIWHELHTTKPTRMAAA